MNNREKKDNQPYETHRSRKSVSDSWIPEKNAVTGFSFKGMGMLLVLVGVVALKKSLFC